MRNMMLQAQNFKVMALCSLFLIALTGCKEKNEPSSPQQVDDPKWEVTVENNLSLSMTAVVKVEGAVGTLAAFMGEECCGVGTYIDGLYHLYISPAIEDGGKVQLKFYSPKLKRIFVATETFPFRNDTQLGTIAEPYTPIWDVTK